MGNLTLNVDTYWVSLADASLIKGYLKVDTRYMALDTLKVYIYSNLQIGLLQNAACTNCSLERLFLVW